MIYCKTIHSPIGKLGVYADGSHLLRITFCAAGKADKSNKVLDQVEKQLQEYFTGKRKEFSIPLKMEGTDFRKKVWQELVKIPYGKTISYQQLAQKIGSINKARAVGNANHYNPIPIIIPCHRVVRKNGDHGGYAGGSAIKEFLLNLEHKNI